MKIKKLLTMIVALLMVLTASTQFEQDKMYVGGSLIGLSLNYNGLDKLNLDIQTQAGYLFEDSLVVLGNLSYQHSGYESVPDCISMGVGGRYYTVQNGIYLGINCKLIHANHNYNDVMSDVEVGYTYFLNRTMVAEPATCCDQSFKRHSDLPTIGFKIGIGVHLQVEQQYPSVPLERAVSEFSKLPGIG